MTMSIHFGVVVDGSCMCLISVAIDVNMIVAYGLGMVEQGMVLKKDRHEFHESVLRAYDIRGVVGETLSDVDAYYLGKAYGSFVAGLGDGPVCVGFDGRFSSPLLEEKLVRGLQETGVDVIRVGVGPTPMLYFAVQHFRARGGIMITGSHNPPTHNGFKMMLQELPVHGEQILKLGEIAQQGEFVLGSGSVEFADVRGDYIGHLVDSCVGDLSGLKVAWDAGNGAAGEMMVDLVGRLQGEHILLNEKIDGSFPVHHPDPSVLDNMQQLIACVRDNGCDLGIAFDGDGDRIGVVDNKGNMLFGDQLMALLAEDVLKNEVGGTVIADVKTSQMLFDRIKQCGGKPLMWKTGHSLIKTKMFEEDAVLAGEMSGHIFFRDNFGFDDGLYAAVKLLNIIVNLQCGLDEKVACLPVVYNTPEIRVEVPEERKFAIVDEVKQKVVAEGVNVNDVDGVRAIYENGWWLLRASNTEAALVVRCEAVSEDEFGRMRRVIQDLLVDCGVMI